MFALIDCNNFFVSCERVFRPDLEHKPVIVLSNNDGCAVARSNEVKKLGIPMGAPIFKYRQLVEQHTIHLFSSNFSLYADMSARVVGTIKERRHPMHIYSIDEVFLELDDAVSYAQEGRIIRTLVRRNVGIPVSVGIAPTKTLAKAANELAKKDPHANGVVDLSAVPSYEPYLTRVPINDVWGIGRAFTEKLHARGVETAQDFVQQPPEYVRACMKTPGMRTWTELNGTKCFDLFPKKQHRKTVLCSRSFRTPVTTAKDLRQKLALYASRTAQKIRQDGLTAAMLTVFVTTNRFVRDSSHYAASRTIQLPSPTASTTGIVRHALAALEQIYKPDKRYKRAGIVLFDLSHQDQRSFRLFDESVYDEKQKRLMQAFDTVNVRWGSGAIRSLATGVAVSLDHGNTSRSPRYTTKWDEVKLARC